MPVVLRIVVEVFSLELIDFLVEVWCTTFGIFNSVYCHFTWELSVSVLVLFVVAILRSKLVMLVIRVY